MIYIVVSVQRDGINFNLAKYNREKRKKKKKILQRNCNQIRNNFIGAKSVATSHYDLIDKGKSCGNTGVTSLYFNILNRLKEITQCCVVEKVIDKLNS